MLLLYCCCLCSTFAAAAAAVAADNDDEIDDIGATSPKNSLFRQHPVDDDARVQRERERVELGQAVEAAVALGRRVALAQLAAAQPARHRQAALQVLQLAGAREALGAGDLGWGRIRHFSNTGQKYDIFEICTFN